MDGIPYETRLSLSERVPEDGQMKVMQRIPSFGGPDVVNRYPGSGPDDGEIVCAVFNMEHGCRNREIIPFLQENPDLCRAGILFANELDDGTFRSGNIDTAKEIAEALRYNYVYAPEFLELKDPRDGKGYEGNAVFSRWPVLRGGMLYLTEEYNWYFSEQPRIGGRVAALAEIDWNGTRIGAVSVHLENRTSPEGRARQMRLLTEKAAEWFGDIPVLIGGDLNTSTLPGTDAEEKRKVVEGLNGAVQNRDPEPYEPLFALAERDGYRYRECNGSHLPTCRDRGATFHLDWIFSRGLSCTRHGMVSTLMSECGWLLPDSAVRAYGGTELSDHNAVWAAFTRE